MHHRVRPCLIASFAAAAVAGAPAPALATEASHVLTGSRVKRLKPA